MVIKLLVGIFFTLAVAFAGVALLQMPILQKLMPGQANILEQSGLLGGTALLHNGVAVAKWRWCPGQGLTAYCVSLAGAVGSSKGIVRLGVRGLTVDALEFERVFGSAPLLGQVDFGPISGRLAGLHFDYRGMCQFDGPHDLSGEIRLGRVRMAGMALDGHRVSITPRQDNTGANIHISGTAVQGDFQLSAAGTIVGQLTTGPGEPNQRGGLNRITLPINYRLPCAES